MHLVSVVTPESNFVEMGAKFKEGWYYGERLRIMIMSHLCFSRYLIPYNMV